MSTKKYILKPGNHQFAPGSAATHHNDNLTDQEARWYLKAYPHIQSLFASLPKTIKSPEKQPAKSSTQSAIQTNEDLSTTN